LEGTGDPCGILRCPGGADVVMIVVDAQVTLVPERYREFIEEVKRILPVVRSETGCSRYALSAEISSPMIVHFLEEWESQRHLDEHLAAPHMQEFFARTAPWHAAPTVLRIYEVHASRSITMEDETIRVPE
jgi:quinol monooxygenase YgiN